METPPFHTLRYNPCTHPQPLHKAQAFFKKFVKRPFLTFFLLSTAFVALGCTAVGNVQVFNDNSVTEAIANQLTVTCR